VRHRSVDPSAIKAIECPFCMGVAVKMGGIQEDGTDNGKCWVYCARCSASGPVADNPREAVVKWNVRRGV
jgi:hypothetical protein